MSQPVDQLYPTFTNPITMQQPTHAPNTRGSFEPVFIVLAVIVFLSAVACVAGRFCSKWQQHVAREGAAPTMASKLVQKQQSHSNGLGPKMWEGRRNGANPVVMNGDIEFGFGDKMKSGGKVGINIGKNERGKVKSVPHKNGGFRPEVRFQDNM